MNEVDYGVQTPFELPAEPGEHVVRLEMAGYLSQETRVKVQADEQVVVHKILEKEETPKEGFQITPSLEITPSEIQIPKPMWHLDVGGVSTATVYEGRVYAGLGNRLICVKANTGEVVWDIPLAEEVVGPILINEGKLYFNGFHNSLYCADLSTGSINWSCDGGPFSIFEDRIYLGGNSVKCLDKSSGALIWNLKIEDFSYLFQEAWYELAATNLKVASGKIFLALRWGGKVACIDARKGTIIWVASPLIDGEDSIYDFITHQNNLYAHTVKGFVYCLDLENGASKWQVKLGGGSPVPAQVYQGKLYIPWSLACLDPSSGTVEWHEGLHIEHPLIFEDSKAFFKFGCVDLHDGKILWKFDKGGCVYSKPAIYHGRIYGVLDDETLYCLDVNTGEIIWKYEGIGRVPFDTPMLIENASLYIGSTNGLFCFNLEN